MDFISFPFSNNRKSSSMMMMMEGMNNRVGGEGGGEDQDMGEEGMQCSDHPYRNNPGGICAFCLQDKLGKLLSSAPSSKFNPSSASSPPPFRSENIPSLSARRSTSPTHQNYYSPSSSSRRARIPFGLSQKKKKKEKTLDHHGAVALKRSKSTATPSRGGGGRFLDDDGFGFGFGPQKRSGGGFWSFLYLTSKPSPLSRKMNKNPRNCNVNGKGGVCEIAKSKVILESSTTTTTDESESPNASSSSSFGRKVSRSRSVGCGSRSFSGDFFDRISTGFGDCTLRRVESHREEKPKVAAAGSAVVGEHHHCIKERVRCGGIFSGFNLTSLSSTSSSSYWVSSTTAEDNVNGRSIASMAHGRSKSWGWALASPMRAFSKPSSKEGKKQMMNVREASRKNATTPNLAAIPSLLSVRS